MILYQHKVLKLQNLSVVAASYADYHFFSRTILQVAGFLVPPKREHFSSIEYFSSALQSAGSQW